jgi:O-antigen/teichoic acid export membrane protein
MMIVKHITNLIATHSERSRKIKQNIFASVFIKTGNILVNLMLIPMMIHYLNPVHYGIWLTINSITLWLNFFDIGLGNGLRNKLASAIAEKRVELAKTYVSTTYFILFFIALGLAVLFSIAQPFISWPVILNAPKGLDGELKIVTSIVFYSFFVQLFLSLISSILMANQVPSKASLLMFIGNLLSLILIFLLKNYHSPSLIKASVALSFSPLLAYSLGSFWYFRRYYQYCVPSLAFVKLEYARELVNVGVQFFVIQISGVVIYATNNLIISQLFSPYEVTEYNISFRYFSVLSLLFNIVTQPFWSAFTDAYIKKDFTWIRRSIRILLNIWMGTFVLGLILLGGSSVIYKIWIGHKMLIPFVLSFWMFLYVSSNNLGTLFVFFINGVGKIKLQLVYSCVGAIANIPMCILLAKYLHMGLGGIILASIISGSYSVVLGPLQYKKIMNGTATGIWAK